MIFLSLVGCMATVGSAMRLVFMNATRNNIPDCAVSQNVLAEKSEKMLTIISQEPCYRSAAHAVGCATQDQIECRCGTSEDQRVRVAAAQCFRATCESGDFNDAMRFADFVCISTDETRPTEVSGDDQEELDDMFVAPTLSVTDLPEDEKQRGTETGSVVESALSTLLSVTTDRTPARTGPPSLGHINSSDDDDDDLPREIRMTTGAQAGIAIGAIMTAVVLGLVGYLAVARIRKARAAKAMSNASVGGDEPAPQPGHPQPEMSELCGGADHGVAPGGGDVNDEWKKKGMGDTEPATELESARSPPPHYACHEMYVEPVELDSRPVEVRPTDDEITPIQAHP
jgi:hypothetical protein